jgi:1-acyl-sn-glycerol-3-phosphate acyltransferase
MVLADRDAYRTAPDRRLSALGRLSPWPELSFYLPVLLVVFRASLLASRGRYGPDHWVASSLGIIEAMEGAGMRLSIEGMENLRRVEGPVVFLSNHMSTLETFVLPSIIQPVKPVTFVVKDSLLRYPVFGPIMRSRDPVAVGRKNPREDLIAVLKGGEERIRRGVSIIVFPQGKRASSTPWAPSSPPEPARPWSPSLS